jgi:hypothetical protein
MELSDQAKTSLNKLLDSTASTLSDAISSTGTLVKENAKELVHEVIVYEGYIDGGMSLLASLIATLMNYCGYAYVAANHNDYWGLYLIQGLLQIGFMVWILCSIQSLLKAKFAPRLFLVQYAASLLKKDSNSDKK